ncbi:hypothetical protein Tc00.1047053503993.20 [Trypanosoma cruzi]|uniref:Uncharacterized protein n=1 Tax=Trypanosoma cruzi (strain CL Brener) TaxID=353153 RepID=Q4CQZ6_TRYCC|nr:hypothetical protein Tc00.1047053503993.20 [Trypanosoma cruzi]EAN82698.1 hypothetical protein Tc00.1047053503993.20 [Trypanosoma cruzi]|eukprot:XP_804549.1 hypothetical protein [Trypanosoma cruzi strain CL Brener]
MVTGHGGPVADKAMVFLCVCFISPRRAMPLHFIHACARTTLMRTRVIVGALMFFFSLCVRVGGEDGLLTFAFFISPPFFFFLVLVRVPRYLFTLSLQLLPNLFQREHVKYDGNALWLSLTFFF